MAIFNSATKNGEEAEENRFRKINEELEKALRESRQRIEKAREELKRVCERVRVAEETEERLRAQFVELEAESVLRALAYCARITTNCLLMEEITEADQTLRDH